VPREAVGPGGVIVDGELRDRIGDAVRVFAHRATASGAG